jgi:hypothetical protein
MSAREFVEVVVVSAVVAAVVAWLIAVGRNR